MFSNPVNVLDRAKKERFVLVVLWKARTPLVRTDGLNVHGLLLVSI